MRKNVVITDRMDMLAWLRVQLEDADAELLWEMVQAFAETLMSAGASCGTPGDVLL